MKLRWRDVDLHSGVITVPRSKHGEARHVPINSIVRSVLFDLSLRREHPDDPSGQTFTCRYTQADKRKEAEEHLATATTMYREMGMAYWLEKAEAEIKELAVG